MQATMQRSNTKNVGVLIFARKRPGFDQEWSKVVRERALALIAGLGYSAVGAQEPVSDDATIHAALDQITAARSSALIVLQPSMTDGQFLLTVIQRWKGPLVLWATPERPGDGKVSSCSLVGAHLWSSLSSQLGLSFELVYGGPLAKEDAGFEVVRADLDRAIRLSSVVERLKAAKIGIVGTHVPGFLNIGADAGLMSQTFGVQLHQQSLVQFMDRVRQVSDAAIAQDLLAVRTLGLIGVENATDEQLAVNSRYKVAIEELLQEQSLDALALQCWPELGAAFDQWPYLAITRLLSSGNPVAIEGDVDGALLALIGTLMSWGTGFQSDWIEHYEHSIFFWHPGMAPLQMCNPCGTENSPALGVHFNGGRRFVVDAPLKVGEPVTVSRLWRKENRYHLTAFEGRAIPLKRSLSGNSLLVEVNGESVPERFDRLVHAGFPHHVTLHYGAHAEALRRLARLIGIEWHK